VDLAGATAHVELAANAGSAHAKAELDSKWRREQPLAAALKAADHALEVDFGSVSIGALMQPSDPDLRSKFDGLIGGRLTAHGNASQLKLDTQLEARRVRAVGDPSSLDVVVSGKYADAKLSVELKAGDRYGQLAEFELVDELNLEQQIAQPGSPLELVTKTRWKSTADFAERRVRELPVISGLGVAHDYAPLTVTTHAKLEHEPDSEPVGELKSVLRWSPTPGAVELGTCSDDVTGTLTLDGQLHDGQLVISVNGRTGASKSQEAIELNTGLQAILADLLAGTPRNVGPLTFDARVRELDLKTTPIACERGTGVVTASIVARDLFDKRADLQFEVNAKGLSWDDNPAADVQINAHPEAHNVRFAAQIKNGRGQVGLDGRFPIDLQAIDPGKLLNSTGPIMLKARLSHMEAAPLLAFVPAVKRVSGTLDGGIDVSGTLQAPVTSGTLQLEDVSFTLPRLGQRFAHLNLKGNLSGRKVRLSEGKVRDLDGRASFDAQFILPSGDAWDADLNVHLRKFPVRKSGVIMGRADANATIELRATPANTDVSVKLSNVAVDLTTQDIAQVQSLDQHPEVFFSDNAPKPGRAAEAEREANAPKTATHATIKILTTEPIWIRRDDFAVQMTTDLKIVVGDEPPSMTGVIALQRGYISLMGQTFDIKRGRVIMTGGTNVDPQLEITATHSDPSGTVVDLEVTGFVTHPELAFSVNGQVVTAGEAVCKISNACPSGGGGGGESVQAQMASMAIGMTTGLLSLGARREFGDWIPRLQFEQGDQTRLRVGFEADKLIPKFMRGFVRGAYVEGIWAGDNNATPGGSASGQPPTSATANNSAGEGVLLELMLPKDLVWAGQYGPGTVWSIDLDWRP
jgi:translocation and assembly module TamB